MSNIVGGGVSFGLTEDEVKTLIGRGQPNGTAALTQFSNLDVPGNVCVFGGQYPTPPNLVFFTKDEKVLLIDRISSNTFNAHTYKNSVKTKLLDASDRNGATATGVAGIYNPCKTILNEHRPVCTKEYHLVGKYLDGAENPDVWFAIKGAGVGASVEYQARELKLNCGTGTTSASRCVIDQTKFPITGNFLEVTAEIGSFDVGEGGDRSAVIGFQPAFSQYFGSGTDRLAFACNREGTWLLVYPEGYTILGSSPLGRGLRSGDLVTIRLDRQEGSQNIDIGRFYVNGQKQFETTSIPTSNVYAGVGVFANNSLVDVGMQLGIKYFGVRYVP